jgi:hypothetical protein
MSVAEVVNLLQSGWKVIEDGRPSASLASGRANAVPHVDDWQALTDVRGPQELPWRLRYSNGFNQDVVDISFVLRFDHSARYKGGGAFITNVWLDVPTCTVSWGYHVNLELHAQTPENEGSATAPLARLPLTVSGSVSTPFWTENKQWAFLLYGNGAAQVL